MTRGGIEYQHMPAQVNLGSITVVRTPFSRASKLELTRELIEQVHQEAVDRGAGRVWLDDVSFEALQGDEALGKQAYTYAVFLAR